MSLLVGMGVLATVILVSYVAVYLAIEFPIISLIFHFLILSYLLGELLCK